MTLGRDAEAGHCPVLEGAEVQPADYFLLGQCTLEVVFVGKDEQRNAGQRFVAEQLVELSPGHVDISCMVAFVLWS